ncbi:MAG: glycosyltransferase family 2 protein [Candidatus Obscuribacterales bacterium]|nr:glycosyltransferase family 2 protein [Candidatus Obscuribacterales bacterium]
MSKPRVSLVVVNWKTPVLLAGALRSVLADPRSEEFEIFVVDNNSADGSVEMLRRDFPSVITIENQDNVGFGRACNQVIPLAKGDYVLLLNPDTVVVESAVSKMADYLERHEKCGAVGPKVLNPDGSLQLACRRSFPTPEAAFYRLTYLSRIFPKNPVFARYNLTNADPDQELEVDALSGSCMMLRNTAIERIGLLDEDIFMFGEDIDWCWRLKEAGWSVRYYPAAVVYHYHGASSRFRRIGATINLHKGMEVFYKKHLASKYWAPFNGLVYSAIWFRALIFIMLSFVQNLLPSKKGGVFERDVAEFVSPQEEEADGKKKSEPEKTTIVSSTK